MTHHINEVTIKRLHGRADIEMSFKSGLNMVYGRNGQGKTALLHILTNAINQDFERFAYIRFETICVTLENGEIILQQLPDDDQRTTVSINGQLSDEFTKGEVRKREAERQNQGTSQRKTEKQQNIAYYFPAFRAMLEGLTASVERDSYTRRSRTTNMLSTELRQRPNKYERVTEDIRGIFGYFVPFVTYRSLRDLEDRLNSEILNAYVKLNVADANLSTEVLSDAIAAAVGLVESDSDEDFGGTLDNIDNLSQKLEKSPFQTGSLRLGKGVLDQLRDNAVRFQHDNEAKHVVKRILDVYERTLDKRLTDEKQTLAKLEKYLDSVNRFLENKQLIMHFDPHHGPPQLRLKMEGEQETETRNLRWLSSGERQIVGMLFEATHLGQASIVLIDEPEISLHVDWQRKIMPAILDHLNSQQVIVATHSPAVISAYRDDTLRLQSRPSVSESIMAAIEAESDEEG